MSWLEHHHKSQNLAVAAHQALRDGDETKSIQLFAEAAKEEVAAINSLSEGKPRTLGVSAISAASLWYKARSLDEAEHIAHRSLADPLLPKFARNELQQLLQVIWNERAQEEAGIAFLPGQVKVAVRGGQVVRGGAPLELILGKVQTIQSMFYRTAEFIKELPFRKKGPPPKEIQVNYKPWLFQSVPGSYQFVVAIKRPDQLELFPQEKRQPEFLTEKFMSILAAACEETGEQISREIPDADYRSTFMKMARNLAPTGKTFEEIEISGSAKTMPVKFSSETRKQITRSIRPQAQEQQNAAAPEEVISGVLRAVHLERDTLEVLANGQSRMVREVGEAVDDLIGPMVNHNVIVRVRQGKRNSLIFVDIELDE